MIPVYWFLLTGAVAVATFSRSYSTSTYCGIPQWYKVRLDSLLDIWVYMCNIALHNGRMLGNSFLFIFLYSEQWIHSEIPNSSLLLVGDSVQPFSMEGWHQCIDFFSLGQWQPSADLTVLPLTLNLALWHFPNGRKFGLDSLLNIWVYLSAGWKGKMLMIGVRNQVFLCAGTGRQNGWLRWHLSPPSLSQDIAVCNGRMWGHSFLFII